MYPKVIRNHNVYVDGESYFGRALQTKLPVPTVQTSAHRGAGMPGTVGLDMGLEAMSLESEFAEWAEYLLARLGNMGEIVCRPAARRDDEDEYTSYVVTAEGLITTSTGDTLNPGDINSSKLMLKMDVRRYRLEADGKTIHDIDVVRGKRVIGGSDQEAGLRRAMGL